MYYSAPQYGVPGSPYFCRPGDRARSYPGHHHVGIDTDCLPVDVIIPEAEPWVHFGDASAMIDMQFEPGEHRVCLHIGDGEHRTLEGLSATVSFTVE